MCIIKTRNGAGLAMDHNEKEPFDELREFLEEQAKREAAKPPAPKPKPKAPFARRHPRLITVLSLGLILASAVYAYYSTADTLGYLLPQEEMRPGSAATELATSACAKNLLGLAAGQETTKDLCCPVSDLDYRLEDGKIYCPEPEKHGLAELYTVPASTAVVRVPR